jgi:centromere protein I
LFDDLSFDVDYFSTIQKLVEHVDRLCVMGLLAEQDHLLLQHASLSFFELVSTMSLQDDIPDIIIPAAAFVHRHFFSTSAMAVSRICGIVCRYKDAFEKNDLKSVDWMSKHTPEYLHHFNSYMMDICNSLWRNLGLTSQGQNQSPFSLTEQVYCTLFFYIGNLTYLYLYSNNIQDLNKICENRGVLANNVLSITHSAALAGFSKRFMTASTC